MKTATGASPWEAVAAGAADSTSAWVNSHASPSRSRQPSNTPSRSEGANATGEDDDSDVVADGEGASSDGDAATAIADSLDGDSVQSSVVSPAKRRWNTLAKKTLPNGISQNNDSDAEEPTLGFVVEAAQAASRLRSGIGELRMSSSLSLSSGGGGNDDGDDDGGGGSGSSRSRSALSGSVAGSGSDGDNVEDEQFSAMSTPSVSDSENGRQALALSTSESAAVNNSTNCRSESDGPDHGGVGVDGRRSEDSASDSAAAEPGPAFEAEISDVHRSNAWGAAYDVSVPSPVSQKPEPEIDDYAATEPKKVEPPKKLTFGERLKAMRERSNANVAKALESAGKP